eukprot:9489660-Pyramimonas_sp.AAC.1
MTASWRRPRPFAGNLARARLPRDRLISFGPPGGGVPALRGRPRGRGRPRHPRSRVSGGLHQSERGRGRLRGHGARGQAHPHRPFRRRRTLC